MIEEGLFTRFLKPLLNKKNEKDGIKNVLDTHIKTPYTFLIQGLKIRIQKISPTQKKELMFNVEQIEKDIECLLAKKYTISF